jgi:hypothetical protein
MCGQAPLKSRETSVLSRQPYLGYAQKTTDRLHLFFSPPREGGKQDRPPAQGGLPVFRVVGHCVNKATQSGHRSLSPTAPPVKVGRAAPQSVHYPSPLSRSDP